MKKICNLISSIILIVMLIILLFVCYIKFVKRANIIKVGKYSMLIVLSGSMEPTIKEKEFIIIKELDKYKINDVITYSDFDGTLITHRIMQIDEYSFIAKGDNNRNPDQNIDINSICGKVIFHSKILGIFILYCLKIIIIVYFIILIILIPIKKKQKEEEVEEE